jgi:hypothetical protein
MFFHGITYITTLKKSEYKHRNLSKTEIADTPLREMEENS